MRANPTFPDADQAKNGSPHQLNYKEQLVLAETVQRSLAFLQPCQP